MELEKFIHHFEEAVEGVEAGTLAADTVFRDLKTFDSLAVLMVTDTVDMEYGVLLRQKDFQGATTLEELYRCVASQVEA